MPENWFNLEGVFKKFEERSGLEAHMLGQKEAPRICCKCEKDAILEIRGSYYCMADGLRLMEEYQSAKRGHREPEPLQ